MSKKGIDMGAKKINYSAMKKYSGFILIFVLLKMAMFISCVQMQAQPNTNKENPLEVKTYDPKKIKKEIEKKKRKEKKLELEKQKKNKKHQYKIQPPDAKKRLKEQERKSRRRAKNKPDNPWWYKFRE
jgi:uncharacterized membrane protein YhiD involved in acid resistance